jgi:hypothetical protein
MPEVSKEQLDWIDKRMALDADQERRDAAIAAATADLEATEAAMRAEADAEQLKANAAINDIAHRYEAELAAKRAAIEAAKLSTVAVTEEPLLP